MCVTLRGLPHRLRDCTAYPTRVGEQLGSGDQFELVVQISRQPRRHELAGRFVRMIVHVFFLEQNGYKICSFGAKG
jgi:hypothetical protein